MILIKQATKEGYIECEEGGVFDASYPESCTRRGRVQEKGTVSPTITAQNNELYRIETNKVCMVGMLDQKGMEITRRVYAAEGVSPTLTTMGEGNRQPKVLIKYRIRKLTPYECFLLMGVTPANARKMLAVNSNSQCYKQAGNSIVVDVMAAMFKKLF